MKKRLLIILLALTSQTIFAQTTAIPDPNFETFLEANGMGNGIANDGLVTTANISSVTLLSFNIQNRPSNAPSFNPSSITDLTGIEDFAALEELNCNVLQLTSLDLTNNTNLKTLYANDNNLTALNVTGLTALEIFECERNQLETLYLNTNPALLIVLADNNALTSLHIKNGNNGAITAFRAAGNPNLSCITVNDSNASYLNDWDKDNTTVFGESCGETSIPDTYFEFFLEANGMGNGIANDNLVTTANISAVTTLDISGAADISNLTGIEDFIALTTLDCSNSSITTIALSTLTNLEYLTCVNNNITELDLTANINLKELYIDTTPIAALDLSQNIALTELRAYSNSNLVSLNIRNGNNMNVTFILVVDTNLSCILVDDPAYSEANWNLGNIIYSDVDCALTFIPDNSFLERLQTIPELTDAFYESNVLTHKIAALTTLDVSGRSGIDDLTGLEDFAALEELDCSDTSITDLDVTQNTALTILHCEQNVLTSLDVSQNVLLTELYCNDNMLTDLDVHLNNLLEMFDCSSNQLTRLNLKNGNNAALTTSKLDINPNLTCIMVDDPIASYLADWVKDVQSSYDGSCGETYVPDDNFEQRLIDLGYDTGALNDYVSTSSISGATFLDVRNQSITDLTGIQGFIAIETLFCDSNNLETIDTSQNIALKNLRCYNNQITSLDLSANTNLEYLSASPNNLTTLDLEFNTALKEIFLNSNDLTTLNVDTCVSLQRLQLNGNNLSSLSIANGNNAALTELNITNNPNLTCVVVDDALAASSGTGNYSGWSKDAQTIYNDVFCDIQISPKVFLQGAALNPNTGEESLMRDDLRVAGYIATQSPYTLDTIDAGVLTITGENAIVDWIVIELRDANDNTSIVTNTSGLLQRDGDIVNFDGVSPVKMRIPEGDYYVSIRHQNHLGIMTTNTVTLSASTTSVDFTDANNQITYGTNAQTTSGMQADVLGMWAGNVNGDTIVQYLGGNSDTPTILATVLNDAGNFLNFPTYTVVGYKTDDANMDGNTQYTGATPELTFILQNVLAHPGNFLNFSTYQILEQLPENFNI